MEPSAPASPSESSQHNKSKISVACINCKARRSKCSGGKPCHVCDRLGIECVYDVTLDKRRKIHWERTETAATLRKEMLHRLFELIRSEDEGVQMRLKGDAHIQRFAQRLGMEEAEYAAMLSQPDEAESWHSVRKTSLGRIREDVGQRGELQKRRAIPLGRGDKDAAEIDLSSSRDQSILPALSDIAMPSPELPDCREQYRIFCARDHTIPSVETISIFGEISFAPTEIINACGSIALRQQQMLNLRIPEYLVQPLLFDEERCPMAAVYTEFRDYGRRRLAEGTPIETVLGSAEVDLALYFRERRLEDPHTPNTWACEYMRLLKDFDVYVALACIFTYARFMRWAIAPSAETYALLPEAMKPTPLQRLVRHHPGVDLPIFPEMRDGLIQDMRDYIVAIQTLGCSVNWGYGLGTAIDIHPETRKMTASDMFAKHICNLSNWSISQKFAAVFPEMRGYYHVVEQETIPISEVNVEEFIKQHGIANRDSDVAAAG